jgi:uncharacterized membrane protein
MKTLRWSAFAFFSIAVGLYPLLYLLIDMSGGLLASKGSLLESRLWNIAFYQHILLGMISMLTGWSQFSQRLRNKNINLHRALGKIYVIAVLLSGSAGFYLALFATGGLPANLGFSLLAIGWLFSTVKAYLVIRNGQADSHQRWMIRSYAFCWAAVTLRIWLPLFQIFTNLEFITAYQIISWLCWVPNLLIAEFIISKMKRKKLSHSATKPVTAVAN